MTLHLEKVFSKFKDITESMERLKAFKNIPLEDFLGDRDKQDIASFRLIVATEAAIDLCLHISAKKLGKVAEEYAACFALLADEGLIDRALASRLGRMARFRNLLVHQYWEIDYARLYKIITGSDMDDLQAYVRQVSLLVERHQ
ncbi:MAG: DUF86 domain-containing protein [Thermodesulfobacteriota bacterium]|nr:DUF86 domain-containing protein [Thermodesulfobacteriota bacterium]